MHKTEQAFNASSTLTPDSMMSDESLSKDWRMAEPLPGQQFDAEKTLEHDVCQLDNTAPETVDCSPVKCESSAAAEESTHLHNCCLLSGIDDSSVNSVVVDSAESADVTAACAELNDALLFGATGDSSLNSTLKASDAEESTSKHDSAQVQPTFSVSIPISTVFEAAAGTDAISDVQISDVSASGGCSGIECVRQAYSPISDVSEEVAPRQTPLGQPSSPLRDSRLRVREFSPISPFTPPPSAPTPLLSSLPVYCSSDTLSLSSWATAAFYTRESSTSSIPATSVAIGKAWQHFSGNIVSEAALSQPNTHHLLGHRNSSNPAEVNLSDAHYRDISLAQSYPDVFPHGVYRRPENQYSDPNLHRRLSVPHFADQTFVQSANAIDGDVSYEKCHDQDTSRLGSAKYGVSQPPWDANGTKFTVRSLQPDMRAAHHPTDVGCVPSVASHGLPVSYHSNLDRFEVHHSSTGSAHFSHANNGESMFSVCCF